ncbi:MAG: radical SAM family heme chaperone HemW [Clostridiales bacterium]|nr:radical SAM family heme chaperone HemW [Clostridiales bacterium]
MAGIYVHVPFCKHKCTYCDFVSFSNKEGEMQSYFENLFKEIVYRAPAHKNDTFDTVYFGGGTPSYVESLLITATLTLIKQNYRVSKDAEITLEMNPGTVTKDKILAYKRAGFNRFSLGLQTVSDQELLRLNRIHTKKEFCEAATLLSGENFSVDIMVGLHDQTKEEVEESLRVALNYGASHVSVYALTPVDGTPLYTDYLNGELPDSDETADLYHTAVEYLKNRGFHRYEISNFALKGKESRHNLNYWQRGEYLGFGIAAHSFYGGERFSNTENLSEYAMCIAGEKSPVVFRERLSESEAEEEFIMLAFRTEQGFAKAEYEKMFGAPFSLRYAEKLRRIGKYLDVEGERVKIKDEYFYVQDGIVAELLS